MKRMSGEEETKYLIMIKVLSLRKMAHILSFQCFISLFHEETGLMSYVSVALREKSLRCKIRSDRNRAVQPQKMTRDLRIKGVKELYYPCREIKCAEQLRGYS